MGKTGCWVPKDTETGVMYVNAVGSSQREVTVYLAQLDLPTKVLERIVIVKAILKEIEKENNGST